MLAKRTLHLRDTVFARTVAETARALRTLRGGEILAVHTADA